MTCKRMIFILSVTLVAGFGFFGIPMDKSINLTIPSWLPGEATVNSVQIEIPDWLTFQTALASPYRRSVRRTARRTVRRTAHRNN